MFTNNTALLNTRGLFSQPPLRETAKFSSRKIVVAGAENMMSFRIEYFSFYCRNRFEFQIRLIFLGNFVSMSLSKYIVLSQDFWWKTVAALRYSEEIR